MSSEDYEEEESKLNNKSLSISIVGLNQQDSDEPELDFIDSEKTHKDAFDVSIDRDDSEGNALPIDEVLDELLEKIEDQKKKSERKSNIMNELHYFHQNFSLEFNGDEQNEANKDDNKGSIVQKIRDSVELKKIKSQRTQREPSIQEANSDTSKLNTTHQSLFELSKFHDFQLPIKRGFLLKKSPTLFQGFQKRYCTLDNLYFNYYLPENTTKIFGSINLQIIEVQIEEIRDHSTHQLKEFKIIPSRSSKVFHFKSCDDNSQTLEEWVSALKQHIEQASYVLYRYKSFNLDKSFWRIPLISEHKFKSECDTGDIILFKNRNIGSAIQRTLTTSQYDHVGMILKYKCGKIVIFESNTKNGVNLTPWDQLSNRNWDKQFEKISYRKLNYKKTQTQVQKFFEFMKFTLGKDFDISTRHLLKSASDRIIRFHSASLSRGSTNIVQTSLNCNDQSDQNEGKSSFFCSELIASCYQYVNLLSNEEQSDSYWPVDFSDKKKLNFLQKAYLSCEYVIIQPIQINELF